MSDLGFLNVSAVTVGQVIPFAFNAPQTNSATIGQMGQGLSDTIVVNNLSGCVFQMNLQPSGRAFTIPAGVPTQPIPLSLNGTNDISCTLLVEFILGGIFPNQVHFDWFSATEPILSVGGAVGVNSGTVSSIAVSGHDQWVISQDPTGNLYFQNITTGIIFYMGRNHGLFTFGDLPTSTAYTNMPLIDYLSSSRLMLIQTPSGLGASQITLFADTGSGAVGLLTIGGTPGTPTASLSVDYLGQPNVIVQPIMQHTNQETGQVGIQAQASGVGASYGYYVNFKTRMTNVPSSITLTSSAVVNATGANASSITKDGFFFQVASVAAGNMEWLGSYTTVGN